MAKLGETGGVAPSQLWLSPGSTETRWKARRCGVKLNTLSPRFSYCITLSSPSRTRDIYHSFWKTMSVPDSPFPFPAVAQCWIVGGNKQKAWQRLNGPPASPQHTELPQGAPCLRCSLTPARTTFKPVFCLWPLAFPLMHMGNPVRSWVIFPAFLSSHSGGTLLSSPLPGSG